MDRLLIAVIVFLIVVMFLVSRSKTDTEHLVLPPTHGANYLRLYEDFSKNSILFEFTNLKPDSSEGLKYMRHVLRGDVKAIDVNLISTAHLGRVRIWNIRNGRNNASSVSDFYENTVYTTPEGRMQAAENLDLLVDVSAGERRQLDMTGPVKKVLIEAYL